MYSSPIAYIICYTINRYIGNYTQICTYIHKCQSQYQIFIQLYPPTEIGFKLLADTSSSRTPRFFWSKQSVRLNVKPHPDAQIKVCKLQVKNHGPTKQQTKHLYSQTENGKLCRVFVVVYFADAVMQHVSVNQHEEVHVSTHTHGSSGQHAFRYIFDVALDRCRCCILQNITLLFLHLCSLPWRWIFQFCLQFQYLHALIVW